MGSGSKPKPHKRGRSAGPSARERHRTAKAAPSRGPMKGIHHVGKSGAQGGKAQRLQAAQQHKKKQREETMARKRNAAKGAPRIVAMMSLHASIDAKDILSMLRESCKELDDSLEHRHASKCSEGREDPEVDISMGSVEKFGVDKGANAAFSPSVTTMKQDRDFLNQEETSDQYFRPRGLETVLCTAPRTRLTLLPAVDLKEDTNIHKWLSVAQVADVLVLCMNASELAPLARRKRNAQHVQNDKEIDEDEDDDFMEDALDEDDIMEQERQEPKDPTTSPQLSLADLGTGSGIDQNIRDILSAWRSLGFSASVATITGLDKLQPGRKARAKAAAQQLLQTVCPGDGGSKIRVIDVDGKDGAAKLARTVSEAAASSRGPVWRNKRPSLFIEAASLNNHPACGMGNDRSACNHSSHSQKSQDEEHMVDSLNPALPNKNTAYNNTKDALQTSVSLVLKGFVRNQALSASQVLHIPELGDGRIRSIEILYKPPNTSFEARGIDEMKCNEDISLIIAPQDKLHALDKENTDSLAQAGVLGAEKKAKKSQHTNSKLFLPEGLADIQAAWLVDDEASDEGLSDWERDSDMVDGVEDEACKTDGQAHERTEAQPSLHELEREQLQFPDEVDTPKDELARARFAKYRGLESFRSSPWDSQEDLPQDYSKIFAFDSYMRARKYAFEEMDETSAKPLENYAAPPGSFVRVIVDGIQASEYESFCDNLQKSKAPLVCWGLLQHECKMSLVHYSISKFGSYLEPIKNKDELLFFNGVRSFKACPVLSVDSPSADKYKMERFLPAGQPTMASMYAPIAFDPLPVIVLKEEGSTTALVATGNCRGADPDRVILKRIVITGFPTKVHRNKATIRHMFYNPEDVKFYKPLELWTKYGRRGRIREPLGTHGLMKCAFDGVIQQRDTICASLFKRVFPKWPDDIRFA